MKAFLSTYKKPNGELARWEPAAFSYAVAEIVAASPSSQQLALGEAAMVEEAAEKFVAPRHHGVLEDVMDGAYHADIADGLLEDERLALADRLAAFLALDLTELEGN